MRHQEWKSGRRWHGESTLSGGAKNRVCSEVEVARVGRNLLPWVVCSKGSNNSLEKIEWPETRNASESEMCPGAVVTGEQAPAKRVGERQRRGPSSVPSRLS